MTCTELSPLPLLLAPCPEFCLCRPESCAAVPCCHPTLHDQQSDTGRDAACKHLCKPVLITRRMQMCHSTLHASR